MSKLILDIIENFENEVKHFESEINLMKIKVFI
jgi:hypothetical protein